MGILTQLQVVNDMLGALGEAPVNSLTSAHPLVATGIARLTVANAREQTKGWWFNTELLSIPPTSDGRIILPSDTLKVEPVPGAYPFAQRGKYLYNLNAGDSDPYFFDRAVTAKIVRNIPFDDLPASAQWAISYGAQLDFLRGTDGDAAKVSETQGAYKQALIDLNAEHIRCKAANLLRTPSMVSTMGSLYGSGRKRLATPFHVA